MGNEVVRIAMWSGSPQAATLLLRSWGNRADTWVWDEPFYAHYLSRRAPDHELTAEILEHHEADLARVFELLSAPAPEGKSVVYQKHTAQYLPGGSERDWADGLEHCLLIRDPRAMIGELCRQVRKPGLAHTGLSEQLEVFHMARRYTGKAPTVIGVERLLQDPRGQLQSLCARVGVDFDEGMLSWPTGPRPTDGVWGRRFYGGIEDLTGFPEHRDSQDTLASELLPMYEESLEYYRQLEPLAL